MESATIPSHHPCSRAGCQPAHLAPGEAWFPTLGELLFLPLGDIHRFSVGFLNLLCAKHLPDTSGLNIVACIKQLELWAKHVNQETKRNFHRFRENPAVYENSEAWYRVAIMAMVLQQDCGVHYNPDCIHTKQFLDSGEAFIHGLLMGKGGSCANMPVLYAAIGRMLGYPIYICEAKSHLFCRWMTKDGGERFNIECTSHGIFTPSDDYYLKWPEEISPREVHLGHFLRNLAPEEELATFMALRGHCLIDRGHFLDAITAFSHAHRLAPANPHFFSYLLSALNREIVQRQAGQLPGSYREAEVFHHPGCPRLTPFVLDDRFARTDKIAFPTDQLTSADPP